VKTIPSVTRDVLHKTMATGFTASLVNLVCATALLSSGVSGSIEPPKGVPLSKAEQYSVSSDSFACLVGGGSISFSRMNDGYCDCADGSDEPGTAACAHLNGAQFYCRNVGHRGKYIPSSHVMDSVCDCCDGSDEASVTGCANTCEEDAALNYASAASRIKILEAGARAKAKYVEAYVVQQAAALEEEKVLAADLDAARAKVSEMEAEEAKLLADSAAERGQYVKATVLRILNRFPIVGQGFEATVATLGLDELRELLVRYARKVDKSGRNLMGLLANENLDEEVDNLLDDEEGDEYTPYEDDYDHEHDWESNGHDYMDDNVHAYDEYGDHSYGDEYGGESMEAYGDYEHDSTEDYGALSHDEYSSGGDYGEAMDSGHDSWATDEGEASDLGDSSSGEGGVGAEAHASAVEPLNENEHTGDSEDTNEVESSVNDDEEIPQMEFVGDEDYLDGEYDSSQSNTDIAALSDELGAEPATAPPIDAEADPLGTAASEPLELPALTAHRRALAEQRKTVKDLDRRLTKLQGASKENLYGPQGEYWLLKGKCLKLDHQQYTYEVPPPPYNLFRRIKCVSRFVFCSFCSRFKPRRYSLPLPPFTTFPSFYLLVLGVPLRRRPSARQGQCLRG